MRFVKLHRNGRKVLVNMDMVSAVYLGEGSKGSTLHFNFVARGDLERIKVDESPDEIYTKMNLYLKK